MNNFTPKKKWGQNFLIDKNICEKIVSSIKIDNDTNILEIGPGTGAITYLLARKFKEVTAVEIDLRMCNILKEKKISNLKIINADILKLDLDNHRYEKIVGNLPYYITTPIMFKFFKSNSKWDEMYFLIQKEVADRIVAKPGTKIYGRLTVMSQIFSKVDRLFDISPQVFRPIPKVKSSLVRFKRLNYNKSIKDYSRFENVIRKIFNQRRKKLKNCISDDMNLNFPINSDLLHKRPEEISIPEFIEIIN